MRVLGCKRVLGAAVVGAVAVGIAGCGSSHPAAPAAGTKIGSSAITQAADVSGAAAGEKVSYSFTEQLPSIGKLTLSGTGEFNRSPEQGQTSLDVSVPGLASLGSEAASLTNLPLTVVIDNKVVYVKLPAALSSKLSSYTGGKPWVSVNLAQLASSSAVPGLSSLLNGQTSPTDPAAMLKELEAASTNGIAEVGTATVNGVATTEYKATLDPAKLSNALPAAQRKALSQALAQSVKQFGSAQLPFDVYIDSAHLIRRLTMNFSPSVQGTTVPLTFEMNFLAYGSQPAPTVPAAGDTDDLTNLLSSYASTMSGTSTTSTLGG